MKVAPEFVSVGVNRVINALDWSETGLTAYAGHHIVCIYDPEAAEVIGTLTGHTGQVNCVKWLPAAVCPAGCAVLLSGAADNSIRVWAWHGQQHTPPWTCITLLQGHTSPVTSLALTQVAGGSLLLASTSADPHLRLWQCSSGGGNSNSSSSGDTGNSSAEWQQGQRGDCCQPPVAQEVQELFGAAAWQQQPPVHVGRQIQHCVALAVLPDTPDCVLMATGGTDSCVRLYVWDTTTTTADSSVFTGIAGDSSSSSSSVLGGSAQQQQEACGPSSSCFRLQCSLKGHENWVKGVAFTRVREQRARGGCQSLLLASAGQDRYGRIWCITADDAAAAGGDAAVVDRAAVDGDRSSSTAGDDVLRKLIMRYAPRPHVRAAGHTYWVTLEALLIGHEDWLHSVSWRPVPPPPAAAAAAGEANGVHPPVVATATAAAAAAAASGGGGRDSCPSRSELTLLTTSQDRSMMLWTYDAPNELWLSDAAVGDAGASCLGFYGGAFNPRGDQLVAHGFTGALHLWQQQQQQGSSSSSSSSRRGLWVPRHAQGGHYGSVQDLAWGADGCCLQSVSTDQTARLFTAVKGHWFELARTQVHGHDFSCLAAIPAAGSNGSSASDSSDVDGSSSSSSQPVLPPACLSYVSGSEEKVLRVFEAPGAFTQSLTAVRSLQSPAAAAATTAALTEAAAAAGGSSAAVAGHGRALGAAVAALGLSNKAVYMDEDAGQGLSNDDVSGGAGGRAQPIMGAEAYNEGPDFVPCAVPAAVSGPPLEEHLAQNTLWPEVRKLYGHGNDVFCVCSSPSGSFIASACKAQSTGSAAVWVWEVGSWKPLAQLTGHTLTVTQLQVSPDGQYLLSGSRDRSWSVWRVPQQYVGAGSGTGSAAAAAAALPQASGGGAAGSGFELLMRLKAAHSRIIWSVSWSHDSSFFATGSRDQSVKLWAMPLVGQQQQQKPLTTLPAFPAGVTAVALSPAHVSTAAAAAVAGTGDSSNGAAAQQSVHLLAVGLEDGSVQVWRVLMPGNSAVVSAAESAAGHAAAGVQEVSCQQLWCSEVWQRHAAAVKRLLWAPPCLPWLCEASTGFRLASCADDHSVRVFNLTI